MAGARLTVQTCLATVVTRAARAASPRTTQLTPSPASPPSPSQHNTALQHNVKLQLTYLDLVSGDGKSGGGKAGGGNPLQSLKDRFLPA